MERKCLFIDDNPDDVQSVLENLSDIGPSRGVNIKCEMLGIESDCWDAEDNLDMERIKEKLDSKLSLSGTYDMVICDFDLEDNDMEDKVTGLDVARLVRDKSKNTIIVLYSGNIEKIAHYIMAASNDREKVKIIKKLFNCKIDDCIDRSTAFEDRLIYTLKCRIPVEVMICKRLEEHSDLKLKHGYSPFLEKTLGEIGVEVNNQTYHGNEFKEDLIERCIAHLVNLNE